MIQAGSTVTLNSNGRRMVVEFRGTVGGIMDAVRCRWFDGQQIKQVGVFAVADVTLVPDPPRPAPVPATFPK